MAGHKRARGSDSAPRAIVRDRPKKKRKTTKLKLSKPMEKLVEAKIAGERADMHNTVLIDDELIEAIPNGGTVLPTYRGQQFFLFPRIQ